MRFRYSHFLGTAAAGALLLFGSPGNARASDDARAWRFKVYLDDKAIGWHTFDLNPADGTLRSEARYDVKFLFVTAYSYAHEATELWDGRCLTRMDAHTDNNGKVSSLRGWRDDGGFVVEVQNKQEQLPGCVQSFAYWDPSILSATRLLNAQTGEYVPVETTRLGRQQISVRGDQVQAQAWRIQARKMQIDLWYSDDGEWLALQAPTESGRVLRYEIQ
jgi:hypothetical protein